MFYSIFLQKSYKIPHFFAKKFAHIKKKQYLCTVKS